MLSLTNLSYARYLYRCIMYYILALDVINFACFFHVQAIFGKQSNMFKQNKDIFSTFALIGDNRTHEMALFLIANWFRTYF